MDQKKQLKRLMDLRSELLAFLEQTGGLLERAASPLDRVDLYHKAATAVENEKGKVSELELRMAIVAPMKAGKSTIVNAILGQHVLPTRESAMTTIPCEIVRDNAVHEPVLRLGSGTIARYKNVWQQLYQEIRQRTVASVLAQTSLYPELAPLIHRVASTGDLALEPKTVGIDDIRRVLDLLNDLCRLSPTVVEGLSPLPPTGRFEVPRLVVPFLRVTADLIQSVGRLVIVDTPGPNEARHHEVLQRVVFEELRSTSLVLVVLDFTQLNTQAADALADQIQHVTAVVGEENLFVVVNKIDQRDPSRAHGMTSEQIGQFVSSHLRLARLDKHHVFEVSAKRALCAADFLRELERVGAQGDSAVRELPSAIRMAPLIFGESHWKEELAEAHAAKLHQRATRLWAMSGFDEFLSQAIELLMREAAPRCIATALKVARAHILTLKNDAVLRRKAIDTGGDTLQKEINLLTDEIAGLEKGRKKLEARLKDLRLALKEQVDSAARSLLSGAQINIQDFFAEEALERSGFWKKAKAYGLMWAGGKPLREINFKTQAEATWFADFVLNHAIAQIRPGINESLVRVSRRVNGARKDIELWIENETRPILDRAAKRLQRQFGVALSVPPPQLGDPLDAIPNAEQMSTKIEGATRTVWRLEHIFWFIYLPLPRKVKDEDRFSVSIDQIARQMDESVHARFDELLNRLNVFLDGDMRDGIDEYFRSLQEYLAFYRKSMESALESQQSTLAERERVIQDLEGIAIEAHTLFERVDGFYGELSRLSERAQLPAGSLLDNPVDLVILHDPSDEKFLAFFEKHLSPLEEARKIRVWHSGRIPAGEDRQSEFDDHFRRARMIVLLVSADFLAAPMTESLMKRAFDRQATGEVRVMPILIRACDLEATSIERVAILPRDRQPLGNRSDTDRATAEVAAEIRQEAERIQAL